jgi:iron complex outermembrane recepter protein
MTFDALKNVKAALLVSSAALVVGVPNPVFAQVSESADNVIGEIIITARKRAEPIQDTPIAITALDAAAIDQQGIKDAQGLTGLVPNIAVRPFNNTLVVAARGISNENSSNLGEASLGFHVNGVYLGRPRGAASLFYDIERVELLRGPQGTLYGRNSTAGALNIITARPEFDGVHGGADFSYGNYNAVTARGFLNVPISDVLSIRGSVFYTKHDGYAVNNRAVPVQPGPPAAVGAINAANANLPNIKNGDDDNQIAGRLSLMYKPSDAFSVLIVGNYHKTDQVGQVRSPINTPGYTLTGPAVLRAGPGMAPIIRTFNAGQLFLPQAQDAIDPRVYSLNTQPENNVEDWDITSEINYDLNDNISATMLTSYREDVNSAVYDNDGFLGISAARVRGDLKQFSNEFRLASGNKSSALDWLIGVYYFDEKQSDLAFINNLGGAPISLKTANTSISSKSIAAFGQIGYELTDALSFTLGARYSHDNKKRTNQSANVAPTTTIDTPFNPANTINNDSSWNSFDWKVGLDYKLNDDSLLYASVSTGYRAGGFNNASVDAYDPEEITAYEIGMKNDLLDRKLRLNLAGFYYDYTNLQITTPGVGANGVPGAFTQNAAGAKIWGLELEAVARPSRHFSVDVSAGYLQAEFKNFVSSDNICRLNGFFLSPASALPGCVTNTAGAILTRSYAGNKLPGAPNITLNVGANLTLFDNDAGSLTARGSVRLVGETFLSEYNRGPDRVASYAQSDLRLTYKNVNQRFSLEGYVQNLEDNDTASSVSVTASGFTVGYNPPRTFGFRVGYSF